jgi:hypothetical protein
MYLQIIASVSGPECGEEKARRKKLPTQCLIVGTRDWVTLFGLDLQAQVHSPLAEAGNKIAEFGKTAGRSTTAHDCVYSAWAFRITKWKSRSKGRLRHSRSAVLQISFATHENRLPLASALKPQGPGGE